MSRKLTIAILALVVISSLIIVSCSKPAPAPSTSAPTPATTTTTSAAPKPSVTTTTAPAQPATVIKWIAQDDNTATNPTYKSLLAVTQRVQAASGGRLVIQPNTGGNIVPADTELEPVSNGVLQMGSNGPILWKPWFPQAPIMSSMFAGPTAMEYFMWYQKGDGFNLMKELFATKNFKITPIAAEAELPEVFLYTNFEIKDLNSVKGKKMRLLGDEAEIFKTLDVTAVATPSEEIYESMKRGVIDGFQHSNLGTDAGEGYQEIAKYAYMGATRQATDMYIFYANTDAFNKLPDDLKQILIDACWTEGIKHYTDGIANAVLVAETWKKAGVVIAPVPTFLNDALLKSANDYYAKMKATDPLWAKIYDSLMGWKSLVDASFPNL